jgi:hypothetical protein
MLPRKGLFFGVRLITAEVTHNLYMGGTLRKHDCEHQPQILKTEAKQFSEMSSR